MKKIIILALTVFISLLASINTAYAAASCSSLPACNNALITKFYLSNDGNLYFTVDGNMTLLQPTCNLYSSTYIVLSALHPSFKIIYSTMLAARLTMTPMSFRMNSSGICTVNYVTM